MCVVVWCKLSACVVCGIQKHAVRGVWCVDVLACGVVCAICVVMFAQCSCKQCAVSYLLSVKCVVCLCFFSVQ